MHQASLTRRSTLNLDLLRHNQCAPKSADTIEQEHARETDDTLASRAMIVVESRASAPREAGDVILAMDAGATTADQLVTLSELVRGEAEPDTDRPRLFKSTGMPEKDAIIASALAESR
jgi:ornithine cyclodeaminase